MALAHQRGLKVQLYSWLDLLGQDASWHVRKSEFDAVNTYQDFEIRYPVPAGGELVRYQINWTGAGNLWVDKIRAHDNDSNQDGHKLFASEYDTRITNALAAYDGVTAARPWRFYLDDEPRWTEKDESVAYVNKFIKAQSGKSGVVAFNQTRKEYMQHFVDTVQPSEFLVDFYPIYSTIPASTNANYNTQLQTRLTDHVTYLGDARAVANSARIPLWAVMQVHNWGTAWREPTPQEIRVQVYLALVHGAKGIYYFMYSSHTDDNGVADIHGLVDGTYATTPKWTEVKSLNAMLEELDDTLLALTSNAVFAGNAPADFVHRLSDTADYHLGIFTHTDGSRYLMVVNRRCRTTDNRTVTVTLDARQLSGTDYTDYVYRMTDVYSNERVTTSPGTNGWDHSFSVSLDPGAGKLYRIEPIQRPSAPENLTVVKVGDGTVTLRWDNPDNATIDNWQYRQNGEDNWQGMSGANAYVYDHLTNTYEYTVRGLTNGTTYTFEVQAHNAAGWGPASESVTATPRLFTLTATARNKSVLLNWTPAPARGASIDRYAYRYSSNGGDTWTDTSSAWVRDLHADDPLSYTVMKLTNDELYTFEMYAYDSAGEVAVALASAIPRTETAAVQVAYGSDSYQAQEGGEAVEVTVRLTGPAHKAVSIPVTVTKDTGTEVGDYAVGWKEHTANSLSFAKGDRSQSFEITANQDADSDDETVTVGLTLDGDDLPSWLGAGTPTTATVRLLDDDGNRTVSFSSVLYEATEGGAAVEVSVRLSPAPWQTVSIPVQVTGTETGDYTVPNMTDGTVTLSFAAGVSSRSFTLTANEDADNADETVSLTFGTLPAGVVAVGTTQQATVRLLDNDGVVSLSSQSPQEGTQLTAELTDRSGGITNTTWQWQRRSNPTDSWTPVAGTSSEPQLSISIYTPQSGDVGYQLQATVEYDDASGTDQSAASAPTAAVQALPETEYAYRASQPAPLFDAVASGTPDNWSSSEITWTDEAPRVWRIERTRPSGGTWSAWGGLEKYSERPVAQPDPFYRQAASQPDPPGNMISSATPTDWQTSNPGATATKGVWRTEAGCTGGCGRG